MKYLLLFAPVLWAVFHSSCSGQNHPVLLNDTIRSEAVEKVSSQVPNSGVFEIKQDSKGMIWVAANDGVYRYDGKSFSNLTSTVSSARFISVLEDRKGNYWLATLGSGVYYYDGKSFQHFTIKEGLASNHVFCLYEDRAGNIWFGTVNGASRYDGQSIRNLKMTDSPVASASDSTHNSVYQHPLPAGSALHNDIHTIIEDKSGKFWFGTRGHTFIYDGKTFTTVTNTDGKAFTNVFRIIEDRKGNIWFGDNGLWRYNGHTFTKIHPEVAGVIVEDNTGNLLAGSGGPIYRYDEQTLSDEKPHVTEINTNGAGLRNLPFGILGADDGSIWFSSGGGLSRYDGKTITDFNSKAGQ